MLRSFVACRAGLAGILVLLTLSCSQPPPEGSASEPEKSSITDDLAVVKVAVVEQISVERRARAVGQLSADEEVMISNQVAGRVERVTVDFGSSVRSGQLLVAIESDDYQLAVARAQAAVVQSLAALGLPPDGSEDSVEVDQIPSIALSQTALKDARTKLESAERLIKNRDISEQRYLEAVNLVEQREAAVREARDRVRVQIATVKVNRAQLAIEEERLAKTRITAPFSGVIQSKEVAAGQYVKENSNLLTLVRQDPLRLRGRVPEASVSRVRKGLSLSFQTDAYPEEWFEAVISDVSPVLDPTNRTLTVEARVPNGEGKLKPGMFATIEVLIDNDSPALVVPESAIISFAGIKKLLLVNEQNQLSEIVVETGSEYDGKREVIGEGIHEGDRVVTSSQDSLQPGTTVRVAVGAGD